MIKNVLESIAGVEIYGIISLVLFFAVFLFMVIRTVGIKKDDIRQYSLIPLDDTEPSEPSNHKSSGNTGLNEGVDL